MEKITRIFKVEIDENNASKRVDRDVIKKALEAWFEGDSGFDINKILVSMDRHTEPYFGSFGLSYEGSREDGYTFYIYDKWKKEIVFKFEFNKKVKLKW